MDWRVDEETRHPRPNGDCNQIHNVCLAAQAQHFLQHVLYGPLVHLPNSSFTW